MLVQVPPPASVRLAELSWILSLTIGGIAVVYLFIVRQPLLPEIAALIRGVDGSRAEETYTSAADILFWSMFGVLVALLLVQITVLVSFANRRLRARWWMLGILVAQAAVYLIGRELVALGERGVALERLLLVQLVLSLLGLLFAILPGALRWTARQHDVRRGVTGVTGGDL